MQYRWLTQDGVITTSREEVLEQYSPLWRALGLDADEQLVIAKWRQAYKAWPVSQEQI